MSAPRRGLFALALALLAVASVSLGGEESPSPRELMREVIDQASADDEVASIRMELRSGDQVRERTATMYSKTAADGNLMLLIRFQTPADLARSGILVLDRGKEGPAQWLYLPAYHTSRRVPPSNRSDTWMGTDFAYEDMSAPDVDRYAYRYLEDERIDGVLCKVVEAVPVDETLKKESGYSKTVSWVDPLKKVALKTDFYDREGTLAKELRTSELETLGKYHRWHVWEMTDLKRGHRTVLDFTERKIDQGLDDDLFTVRSLERAR
jgi:outer membrane lipoprotein-sorting protein